jgi:AcrR family transcriptional regulator
MKEPMDAATPSPESQKTRSSLLEGALRVFAREGLQRATIRMIAEESGVNELTVFRHFQNKDRLISSVFDRLQETSAYGDLGSEEAWSGDLRTNLTRFAHSFYELLEKDEAFIRTLIGEARRHPIPYRKIIMDAFRMMHERLKANLEAAAAAGTIRKDVIFSAAADMFVNLLLAGMLKNTEGGCNHGYTSEEYVATCVDLFATGLERKLRA